MLSGDTKLSVDDLVQLCSVDDQLFCTTFFPKAARQPPAPFHADIWRNLNDPAKRYLNLVCFRDSAKTTILRMFTGKRVAFNVSKTILYVSASEAHAARSIRWLRTRIESKMGADPEFYSCRYSCWTPQTLNLDVNQFKVCTMRRTRATGISRGGIRDIVILLRSKQDRCPHCGSTRGRETDGDYWHG
jgi:hypothetical protein